MWSAFSVGDKNYFFHYFYENNVLTVRLTNLVTSWKEVVNNETIVERFKESNSIDGCVEVDTVVSLFKSDLNPDSPEVTKSIKIEGSVCNLNLSSGTKDISYNFSLTAVAPDEFYKDITLPLLLVINELKVRQDKLKSLLKEKDDEITEYQFEGGKLFRSYLKTNKFDDKIFEEECDKNTETNASDSVDNINKVFNDEFNLIYLKAVKVSQNHIRDRNSAMTPVKMVDDQPSPSKNSDSKRKNLKWEIGPQNVKRFKTNKAKIKF